LRYPHYPVPKVATSRCGGPLVSTHLKASSSRTYLFKNSIVSIEVFRPWQTVGQSSTYALAEVSKCTWIAGIPIRLVSLADDTRSGQVSPFPVVYQALSANRTVRPSARRPRAPRGRTVRLSDSGAPRQAGDPRGPGGTVRQGRRQAGPTRGQPDHLLFAHSENSCEKISYVHVHAFRAI